MEYVKLTGTGIEVSKLCIGAMTLGDQVDEKTGVAAVEYAIGEGVNFFDTANVYTNGRSEEILGKAVAGKRDSIILASKVGSRLNQKAAGLPNDAGGLSRRYILKQIESSLKRLKTDYLDIYYLHAPDALTPVEETLGAMDTLVRSGKVRYIGASNYAAWQLCQMYYQARSAGLNYPVVTQMVYNIITRGIEQEFLPFLRAHKLGLVVYNPLAAGFLTDKYKDKRQLPNTRFSNSKMYADRYWNEENFSAWDDLHAIAEKAGIGMLELAMRWLYGAAGVDAVITGFSKLEQLRQNLKTLDKGGLDKETMAECDKVWGKLAGTRFKYNRD
ncbi:MAG: aldo/keto reductase [Acidaminococcales bacterium]|nr:aldo/keto reductase [Acidaminococcales bacterium]